MAITIERINITVYILLKLTGFTSKFKFDFDRITLSI